jgi:hypothetical protein
MELERVQASLQPRSSVWRMACWTEEQYEDEDVPIYVHPPQAMTVGVEDDGP